MKFYKSIFFLTLVTCFNLSTLSYAMEQDNQQPSQRPIIQRNAEEAPAQTPERRVLMANVLALAMGEFKVFTDYYSDGTQIFKVQSSENPDIYREITPQELQEMTRQKLQSNVTVTSTVHSTQSSHTKTTFGFGKF